ncbi:MAG: acyl-CoA thioesterase [Deltaproteobacteria bacterium]|nr:acyl-CoA thioesterase [Deltaproteobacteria bacterium]
MENPLTGYPVVIEIPVAWGDMDSFQHVNNVVYFRWFESARVEYLYRLGTIGMKNETGVGPILASLSCKFKMPLRYPDRVLAGVRVTNIREDRFTMDHMVFSTKHQKAAAQGDGVIVMFDYRSNRKVTVSDELSRRIMTLDGRK